jgi:hypothetical protein
MKLKGGVMKIKALALSFLIFIACGTPIATMVNLYPKQSDFLFDKMVVTLQDLKWQIENMDKPSLFISAKKLTSGEAFSAAISGQKNFHIATINFIKKNGETSVSVQVSQPGVVMKYSKVCERLAKEIIDNFNERIK